FSDILLMYAEAENELNGPTAEAIAAVNQVRQRAWASGIKSITVINGGSGYTTAPSVTFSGNGGAEATATITNGTVTAITLTRDPITFYKLGSYSSPPTITINGGGGTGAEAIAEIYSREEANLKPEDYASKESFRQLIMDERMRELNFEGMRKSDLIRWGIFVETMQDMANYIALQVPTAWYIKAYNNVEAKHLLMAIPTAELNVNLALKQNAGWE
ncbi:MAG: RagB/SusD family nutrient uptake outer membrane protein, partial [Bacteroidales bacterium]|nr:RagB/SusD family nutrient uptake outer membrane protein [Bacteroidales bacterium]